MPFFPDDKISRLAVWIALTAEDTFRPKYAEREQYDILQTSCLVRNVILIKNASKNWYPYGHQEAL